MSTFLEHIIRALWKAPARLFWPFWVTVGIAVTIFVVRLMGRATIPIARQARSVNPNLIQPRSGMRKGYTAVIILAMFLACYVTLILAWEDFAYSDNSMFTIYTLKGQNLPPPIWPSNGRFFPLGHQEFNVIRHFTATIDGYHALPIVELLILTWVLLVLDDELGVADRALLAALVLITPGIVISFGGLIYTERNLVLCLVCLVLFVKRFEQTQATAWAVAAVVCAQIMIYYKEVAFLLLWGFAVGRLWLRSRSEDHWGWDYHRLRNKESCLDCCLASLGLVFLLYYMAVMLPHPTMQYAADFRLSAMVVFLAYLKLDLLVWVFGVFAVSRGYLILRNRVTPSLLWDGLAVGGLLYFAAYLCLGMFSAYYLTPVDIIAILYIGHFAILSAREWRSWGRYATMTLVTIIFLQSIVLSAFRLYERKNTIHGKSQIASVVEGRYRGGGEVKRIFFPFASPYRVMEFASYLNYRGVPVERTVGDGAVEKGIEVVSRTTERNGLCVAYRPLICHVASSPDSGDLVILLPDDDASQAEAARYRDQGELVLSYEPSPHTPQWLYPLVRRLHIVSPPFAFKQLPDHWLQASVTAWK